MKPPDPIYNHDRREHTCPCCGYTYKLLEGERRMIGHECTPSPYVEDFVQNHRRRQGLVLRCPRAIGGLQVTAVKQVLAQGWKDVRGQRRTESGDSTFRWCIATRRRNPVVRALLRHHIPCFAFEETLGTRAWIADLLIEAHEHGPWDGKLGEHVGKVLVPVWARNHRDPITHWWQKNWPHG